MALPRKLKNFNLFNDANSFQGLVPSVTLPKLARKMEAYRGGGMDGEVDIDLGQEKLDMEWVAAGFNLDVMKQYGNVGAAGILLRFNGAYQEDINCAVQAVQVVVRGRHAELDMGEQKTAEGGDTKIKSSLSYYKLSVDNQDVIEIDLLNFIFIVNGVDQLAAQRQAMGL